MVTQNSSSFPAVTITLSGDIVITTPTNSIGNYTFSSLADGQTYTVTPTKANFSFGPKSSPETLSGSNISGVNFAALVQEDLGCGTLVSNQSVTIVNQATGFSPKNLSISVGDVVKWHNNDSIDHTVTSGTSPTPDGVFDSGHVTSGSNYCVKFIDPTHAYPYFCSIHTTMTGTVTVP